MQDAIKVHIGRLGWDRIGLAGRRALIAAGGGILAVGGGAEMGAAFHAPTTPVAETVDRIVPDELPSQAAARAYALDNPPSYRVAYKTLSTDVPSVEVALATSDPRSDVSDAPEDDATLPTSSTTAPDDAKTAPPPAVVPAPDPAAT
jgi:hypothetical protein